MYKKIIEFLKDKNIAIVGYGKEGKSTYNFIRKYLEKQKITILDGNENLAINNKELESDENVFLVVVFPYQIIPFCFGQEQNRIHNNTDFLLGDLS